jgi:hypothetical protein
MSKGIEKDIILSLLARNSTDIIRGTNHKVIPLLESPSPATHRLKSLKRRRRALVLMVTNGTESYDRKPSYDQDGERNRWKC